MTRTTKNYLDLLHAELAADPELAEQVEIELFNSDLAMKVYKARTDAKLTQKQLADLVGTRQSVVSRIEDADYYGRSLTLLRRIAKALRLKLRVEFCDEDALQDSGRQPSPQAAAHGSKPKKAISR